MVDNVILLLCIVLVVPIACELCYYEDGTLLGETVFCPGGCCGNGSNPCCPDPGSMAAVTTGVVISVLLFVACAAACCINNARFQKERATNRSRTLPPEIRSVSNEFHEFNTVANGQLQLPPRYSDLYPKPNDVGSSLNRSNSTGSQRSIERNSSTRRGIRRSRSSNLGSMRSRNITEIDMDQTSANNVERTIQQQQTENNSHLITEQTHSRASEREQDTSNNGSSVQTSRTISEQNNLGTESVARSSLMTSIVENLPTVFENNK